MPRSEQQLKERRELCKDLEYLICEDRELRVEIIDEYVYMLDEHSLADMQTYVNKQLEL